MGDLRLSGAFKTRQALAMGQLPGVSFGLTNPFSARASVARELAPSPQKHACFKSENQQKTRRSGFFIAA
jgi:hypothetical protein